MKILQALGECEVRSEQCRDAKRVVAFNGQATALRGRVEPEGSNDCASTNLESASHVRQVRVALLSRGEEMEDCAIVLNVDR